MRPIPSIRPALLCAVLLTMLPIQASWATPTAAADTATVADLSPAATLSLMERVGDWQLAHPSAWPDHDWTQAVGYTGFMALSGISGQARYRDAMLAIGQRRNWQLGPDQYHADDQAIGQTYAELYLQLRDPDMIAPMRAQFDRMLADPRDGSLQFDLPGSLQRWSWCDALFMAPPAWIRLYAATGDERYLQRAVDHWWRTSDYLYDPGEHLYFRDSTYFKRREANGQKVFWSRGNGWVMGGLVRMLQYLPAHHPSRPRFEQQFREMAARLVSLQQQDGLWRSSLLDPASYPLRETSGTALTTYALAWGVNQQLLPAGQYRPAVKRAWQALAASVQPDGKLIHVQPIGKDPKTFPDDFTDIYGVGGFLLAGSEIYRMGLLERGAPQVITVSNGGALFRSDETVQAQVRAPHPVVMDALTSRMVNSQPTDGGVLFQAVVGANDQRRYLVLDRDALPAVPPADVKTHARFVPERFDDFAWENDRIAHRMYGPALMTAPGEMLVSSGVDVWAKSARRPVIDAWYRSGNYHQDHGEGLDFYSVGKTLGCGGLGVYSGGKLYSPANFARSRVLADGPIRSEFELRFARWDAAGRAVSEVRRLRIDAGSSFTRVESRFDSPSAAPLPVAVGVATGKGDGRQAADLQAGWISYWQAPQGQDGSIACAVIVPGASGQVAQDEQALVLAQAIPGQPFVYYLGAGWSKAGYATPEAWQQYVRDYAAQRAAPLTVSTGAP
ncbi:glycoside hydrolase family 88 protein [Duganella callida]|uniref:DUF4861 domain-containing protein n=1 Tax=Duganella callida TaxID=2561932 RepID=A0A4Y9S6G7_9BURK|nr:glycoside hydrolase family 88 protein [Duganella callida]TFW16807.1 DUF4861 domain-containing protein [Duganella callida]